MSAAAPTSRSSGWEWLQAALLAANIAWTTLCLGGFLAETMVLSCALTGSLVAVHFGSRLAAGSRLPRYHPAGWLLLPFLAYAAANVGWVTPVRWLGWQDWYNWAQMTAVFWVVVNGIHSHRTQGVLLATLAVLAVLAVAMASYQRFVRPEWMMLGRIQPHQFAGRASGPFGIPNSLAGFLILLIPPSAALACRSTASAVQRVLFGWLTLVMLFGLGLTISRGAWLALAVALVAWPLIFARRSWLVRVAIAASLLLVIAAVVATTCLLSPTVRQRIQSFVRDSGELSRPIIWRAAGNIFRSHPILGSGAGSFAVLFERHRPDREQTAPRWAHNDYLNTLSDYGSIGGVLLFGASLWIIVRSARRRPEFPVAQLRRAALDDPFVQQAFAIGLLAFALQLAVEFHLKIPALGLTVATIAGVLVSRRWPWPQGSEASPTWQRPVASVASVVVIAGIVVWVVPMFRAEGRRQSAFRQLERVAAGEISSADKLALAGKARDELAIATRLDPRNGQAWADLAFALAALGHEDVSQELELGKQAERAARIALRQGSVVAEYWLRLGVALDMQHRWLEAGDAFSEALRLAPRSSQSWFYQAYHFALNPITRPLAKGAVATCLRLDPGSREGEALRRYLAAGH